MSKQKSVAKSKQKSKEKVETNTEERAKQKVEQKLSLHLLQKQKSLLQLEEALVLAALVGGGIIARTLLQGFPSVEPITFFAVLAGALFGSKKGAATGASAWFLSNFFMFGGQGPWSLVHIAAGVAAGWLGGLMIKTKNSNIGEKFVQYGSAVGIMFAATLIFEVMMNISSGFFFGFGIIISFLSAIPFMLAHLGSNIGLALLIPKTRDIIWKKGRFSEKAVCEDLTAKLKQKKATN